MNIKLLKSLSKYLGSFVFFVVLLKGCFPLKQVYAQSSSGCVIQPACIALVKAEAGIIIAAPTAVPSGVSLVARYGPAAIVLLWDQPLTEYAQVLAKEKYCTANPNDSVCVPFTGGQCPILYNVWPHVASDGLRPSQPPVNYPNSNYADRFWGPILDTRVNYTQSSYGSYYNASWEILAHGRYWSYGDWSPTPTPVWRGFGGSGPADPKEKTKVFIYEVKPNNPNQLDNCGNPPPSPWKDWPQAKRKAAVDSLPNSDWQDFTELMTDDGVRLPDEPINGPIIVIEGKETDDLNTPEDERQPKKVNGPLKWPTNVIKPWPDWLNKSWLNDREKARLDERVTKGKLTQADVENIKPRPIPDDPNNKKCSEITLTGHLGDSPKYPYHGQYATKVTGSPNDLYVMAPNGNYAYYDGQVNANGNTYLLENEGAVAEMKTQHEWLIKFSRNEPRTAEEITKWIGLQEQLNFQAKVAQACKLQYFIAFDLSTVVKFAGPMLVNLLKATYPQIRIHFMPSDRPGSASLLGDLIAKSITTELTLFHTTSFIAQQSADKKLAKYDIKYSKLADNKFEMEGHPLPQQNLGGLNNGELNGKHSKLSLLQQQSRTKLSRSTAVVFSR